jgi:hypothetical protein
MKRSARMRVGRKHPRFPLAVAIAAVPGVLLIWAATPGFMEPMFYERPWDVTAMPLLGVVGVVIGEVLMFRVYGTDPDAGERTWRYRDF